MAMADYHLCDVCEQKCFYDANLNWETEDWEGNKVPVEEYVRGGHAKLDYCGDMACICTDCAKTHKCTVVKIEDKENAPS